MVSVSVMYSEEVKHAISIAQSVAKEYKNEKFSPAHLLFGLMHNDVGLASYLVTIGKDVNYIRDWAEVYIEMEPKSTNLSSSPSGTNKISVVLETADVVRLKLGMELVTPLAVLGALVKPNVAFGKDQLKTLPLTENELIKAVISDKSLEDAINPIVNAAGDGATGQNGKQSGGGTQALHKFCTDKTSLAQEGKIDPIVGRDREIRTISEILGRRTKPNVIVVGEPGVGKTALIDGFALEIIAENVPERLKGAHVFELDTGALIAGAAYKGEIEDRLKKIIAEIKKLDKAILFIDEIHMLLDSGGSIGSSAANLLKPELARGDLTVLGATTNDEYREFIEADEAFSRRFEIIKVEEPDEEKAYRMMKTLVPYYEGHHELKITDEALKETIRLSKRYIKDRRLPDASIDLMDQTMAAIRMMDETSESELKKQTEELEEIKKSEATLADVQWFYQLLRSKVSPVLFNQLEDETQPELIKDKEELIGYLERTIETLKKLSIEKKEKVSPSEIAAVVAYKTGIPLGKIQSKEKERLLSMEDVLKKRVVGQDHALKSMSEAILESRSGLAKAGQPIGSFFFLGPTGTGKTELAKSMAEFLFNHENTLLRFDMSEFKEEHSAALLYGAPPGYVGYKEGGLLVNKIRQNPYSIVLFDEIEKAHSSVFDIFLQILDEGKLHDRLGKEGDFSNSIILFTSNIGSDFVMESFNKGEIPTSDKMLEIMSGHFRPEFLARLTEIVPFAPISEEVVELIFGIHLKKLVKTLEQKGIDLELTPEAKTFLANAGYNQKYGARPLTGIIRSQLRRPISRMIISNEVKKGNKISVGLEGEDKITWTIT